MLSMGKQVDGTKLTLTILGRIDTETAKQLEEQIDASLDGVTDLVFDLGGLDYVSSAGIRTLLTSVKKMGSRGGTCVLTNVRETIMDVFETTGLLGILTFA